MSEFKDKTEGCRGSSSSPKKHGKNPAESPANPKGGAPKKHGKKRSARLTDITPRVENKWVAVGKYLCLLTIFGPSGFIFLTPINQKVSMWLYLGSFILLNLTGLTCSSAGILKSQRDRNLAPSDFLGFTGNLILFILTIILLPYFLKLFRLF